MESRATASVCYMGTASLLAQFPLFSMCPVSVLQNVPADIYAWSKIILFSRKLHYSVLDERTKFEFQGCSWRCWSVHIARDCGGQHT